MHFLEHKIPPPIVGLLVGALMWYAASLASPLPTPDGLRFAAAVITGAAGLLVALAGQLAFRKAQTTINPMKPEAASSLVITGAFRYTRNPMYVGFTMVLLAWALFLASPLALAGPVIFALFITRFQILPEERALNAKFGRDFAAYQAQVRRWL
jgi:protein-S-isoprenylcysteine O-methyltransferase Ste14